MNVTGNPIDLAGRFPSLRRSYPARLFLESCTPDNIQARLASRRIVLVKTASLWLMYKPTDIGLFVGEDKNFFVLVDSSLNSDDQAVQLGKAIAETFRFNLTKTPPVDIMRDVDLIVFDEFREAFAESWAMKFRIDKVLNIFEKERTPCMPCPASN